MADAVRDDDEFVVRNLFVSIRENADGQRDYLDLKLFETEDQARDVQEALNEVLKRFGLYPAIAFEVD